PRRHAPENIANKSQHSVRIGPRLTLARQHRAPETKSHRLRDSAEPPTGLERRHQLHRHSLVGTANEIRPRLETPNPPARTRLANPALQPRSHRHHRHRPHRQRQPSACLGSANQSRRAKNSAEALNLLEKTNELPAAGLSYAPT